MKEVVLITGASGVLAKVLSKKLEKNYIVKHLTTNKKVTEDKSYFKWDVKKNIIDYEALKGCKHIIHLAGYSILKRWTKKNKKIMYESRVNSTNLLLNSCKKIGVKPATFICASAMGIYDQDAKKEIDENGKKGTDWVAKMALDWENASNKFKELGTRVVQIRISLIFSKIGGFLKYNLLSLKYGIGIIAGDPNRKINWMYIDDIVCFIQNTLEDDKIIGPYNLNTDDKITQVKLIKTIRKKIFPYSIILKIPNFMIDLLLGEKSKIINTKIILNNTKLKNTGFKCKYNTFEQLINNYNETNN